jgi:serine/threonine-protein phosphatase 2B catalytic subunit
MMKMFKTLREENELIMKLKGFCPDNKIPKGMLLEGKQALMSAYEKYKSVKELDSANEKRPKNYK